MCERQTENETEEESATGGEINPLADHDDRE